MDPAAEKIGAPQPSTADADEPDCKSNDSNSLLDDSSLQSFDDLLPPSKLYAGNIKNKDADLDALLEIDMDHAALKRREKLLRKKNKLKRLRSKCFKCFKIGNSNITVLQPTCYRKYKLCIVGPHWLGLLFTWGLLYGASYYFTCKAYNEIGVMSAAICILFTATTSVNLFLVSNRDPGVVCKMAQHEREGLLAKDSDDLGDYAKVNQSNTEDAMDENERMGEEEGWRYCAICEVYQPPTAAHCPDCNVCVDGYDHHCPWMGVCIGKGNYRSFMAFNLSWLLYLIYAASWVSAIGPKFSTKAE